MTDINTQEKKERAVLVGLNCPKLRRQFGASRRYDLIRMDL